MTITPHTKTPEEKHKERANTMARYILNPSPMIQDEAIKYIQSMLAEVEAEVYNHLDIPQIRNDSYKNGFEQGQRACLVGCNDAWKNLKAPINETITSQWYFEKGYEAGQKNIPSTTTPEQALGEVVWEFKQKLNLLWEQQFKRIK